MTDLPTPEREAQHRSTLARLEAQSKTGEWMTESPGPLRDLLALLDAERAAHAETLRKLTGYPPDSHPGLAWQALNARVEKAEHERQALLDAVWTADAQDDAGEHAVADAVARIGVLYEVDAAGNSGADALRERLAATEAERDEAQAALVVLREAAIPHVGAEFAGDAEVQALRCAIKNVPAALAGQVRARVLREAADAATAGLGARPAGVDDALTVTVGWLRARAAEAEKP